MENYELGSLDEYIYCNGGLNEDEVREIASCCLLGLDYLRSLNTMHGVVDD